MSCASCCKKTEKETKVHHCPLTQHCGLWDKEPETGFPQAHATGPTAASVWGCAHHTNIQPDATCSDDYS